MRCALAIMLFVPGWIFGQTVVTEPLGTTFSNPVFLTGAGDRSNRLFVVEQAGRVYVLDSASDVGPDTFLDIRDRVLDGGERGLLGLAFHPGFAGNRRLFVNYTRRPDGATVVAEFQAAPDGRTVGPDETVLLVIGQPYANHNGGMIAFGPDGDLYIGTGDGGAANDPENRAQNTGSLLGKMLRIDVDQRPPGATLPYGIPSTNPFVGSGAREEIYAVGLRNPWRFSFDRSTGMLWTGDVGQNAREEINVIVAGGNYGWRVREGTRCTNLGPASCSDPGLIDPVTEYDNGPAGRCSVTGGYVYRGVRGSLPYGAYVFADYCTGEIFMFHEGVQTVVADTPLNVTSFGADESDELYVVTQSGTIAHLKSASAPAPLGFQMAPGATVSWSALSPPALSTGFARVDTDPASGPVAGTVLVEYAPDGPLVSEVALRAAMPAMSGRIHAPQGAGTGVAIANPNMQTVRIGFRFIDASGAVSGDGIADIPPGEAISGFLSGAPFHGPTNAESTFAFDATLPVLAAALGGETNSRGGFIMSERPVFDPGVSPPPERRWVPLVARGGGWTTDVVLVNTTGQATSGRVALRFPSDPQPELEFEYLIPAGAARRIAVQSTDPTPRLGFARVDPDPGALLPEAYADVRQTTAGTPTGATSVRASPPVDSVRILVQSAGLEGTIGAVRQAVGLVSTGGEEQIVAYALRAADGSATPWSGQLPVPANGYVAMFVHQMPGLEAVPDDFTGTLVIDAPDAAIAAIGLRARWNTAGDFVFTANGPLDTLPSNAAFPYFAIGGGYRTRFVLLSDASGVSGEIDFRGADGRSLAPPFEGSVTGTGAFSFHSPARAR